MPSCFARSGPWPSHTVPNLHRGPCELISNLHRGQPRFPRAPKQAVVLDRLIVECRDQTATFEWSQWFSMEFRQWVSSRNIDTRGHNVDQVGWLRSQFVFSSDAGWPVGDQRRCNTSFMIVVLVESERRVLKERPAFTAEPIR